MSELTLHFEKSERLHHDVVPVYAFHGVEELSAPYQYEIGIRVTDSFSPTHAIGLKATLKCEGGGGVDGEDFSVHGKIAAIETMGHEDGVSTYQLVLVPSIWNLSLAHHSRAWTHKSILTIFREILIDHWGFHEVDPKTNKGTIEFRVHEHLYGKRDLVCQYNETDLAFISRWMEREGMFFFFEQGHPGTGGLERMVITDKNPGDHDSVFSPHDRVHYGRTSTRDRKTDLDAFHGKLTAVSYDVETKDYDYRNPDHAVSGGAQRIPQRSQQSSKRDQVVLYGENLKDHDEAQRIATVRAQAIAARRHVIIGGGSVRGFKSGYKFRCETHVGGGDVQHEYLVTRVEHWASTKLAGDFALRVFERNKRGALGHLTGSDQLVESDEAYHVRFRCIPCDGGTDPTYRHPQETPIPRIHSIVRGTLTGKTEVDAKANITLYGVKLDFDELGTMDIMARLVQPHGGMQFTMPPHAEVLVEFLAGNVDRPIISNVVPNAKNPGPTAKHGSNVIESLGKNRIELDDDPESQSLTASSPIDNSYLRLGHTPNGFSAHLNTNGSSQFTFGERWRVKVGGPASHTYTDSLDVALGGYSYRLENAGLVRGRVLEHVGEVQTKVEGLASHDFDLHALVARRQDVEVKEAQEIKVGQAYSLSVGQGYSTQVNQAGDHTVTARSFSLGVEDGGSSSTMTVDPQKGFVYDLDHVMTVNQDQTVNVKRDHFMNVTSSHWLTAAAHNVRIDGNHETQVGGGFLLTAVAVCDVVVGQSRMTVRPDGFYHPDQHKVTVEGSHRMTVEADHDHRVDGNYGILAKSYALTGADSVTITSPMTIIS